MELAHEQLATQWARYPRWLRGSEQRAEHKSSLDRLMERAARWARLGKKWRDLATGSDRTEFHHVGERQHHWLAPLERRFVGRSQTWAVVKG